jgi:Big-like domain-containing protein
MSLALRHLAKPWTLALSLGALTACGGTDSTTPPKDVVPASITAVSTDTIHGVVGQPGSLPLAVIVKNKNGDLLDTTLVTFAIVSGNGTLGSTSVRTDATGKAQTTWNLGGAIGVQKASAAVGTLTPITFVALATVGPATTLSKAAGDNQSAVVGTNVAIAPSVKVVDAFGNGVSGVTVTFTVTAGGGLVSGGSTTTGADGTASAGSWKLGASVGANTLVATAPGGLTATFTATATVGAAASITLTPTTIPNQFVGQTVQLTSKVMDASGNVLTNAVVAYTTSNAAVATVSSPGGLVTAVGSGTATITATVGTANASVPFTVIGHPAATGISSTFNFNNIPTTDIAFSNNAMFVAVPGLLKVFMYDANATAQTGVVTLPSSAQFILAPTHAAGPAVAISAGAVSRVWFIDPGTGTVIDSLTINDVVTSATMTSDGRRVYVMQTDGTLNIIDGATHAIVAKPLLGGGFNKIVMAPGDTTVYALAQVGVLLGIDTRTNQQVKNVIVSQNIPDWTIGQDGLFYFLDQTIGVVRVYNITTQTVVRFVSTPPSPSTVAVSPDSRQIWLTSSTGTVAVLQGDVTNGFLPFASFPTSNTAPAGRAYLNPSGAFAALTNIGGVVDIVR